MQRVSMLERWSELPSVYLSLLIVAAVVVMKINKNNGRKLHVFTWPCAVLC
jgi:hypothetical protein